MKSQTLFSVIVALVVFTSVAVQADKNVPDCPVTDYIVFFPFIGDCTKFWECYEGHAYLYNCPSGLWWHQLIEQCDYPGDFCQQ